MFTHTAHAYTYTHTPLYFGESNKGLHVVSDLGQCLSLVEPRAGMQEGSAGPNATQHFSLMLALPTLYVIVECVYHFNKVIQINF